MNEEYSFLALLYRQKYIKRWSLMRCTEQEDLSHHSFECAVVAHMLALINRDIFDGDAEPEMVALAALYHDASEVLSGDLPTPIKYHDEVMRSTYKNIERSCEDKLISKLPSELAEAYAPLIRQQNDELTHRLVKTADKLCALIKCTHELKGGNSEFKSAKAATEKSLEAYASSELDYFMEHVFPAFTKDIDEL